MPSLKKAEYFNSRLPLDDEIKKIDLKYIKGLYEKGYMNIGFWN